MLRGDARYGGAEVRIASPAGGSSGTCTASEPVCSLQHAVSVAVPGDQVAMLPGDYPETTPVTINAAIGVGGIERPAAAPDRLDDDRRRSKVTRRMPSSTTCGSTQRGGPGVVALDVEAASTAERVIATSSANIGCLPAFGAVIRDSVCLSTAANQAAVRFIYSGDIGPTPPTSTATLRNVTAVATNGNSHGIEMQTQDVGVEIAQRDQRDREPAAVLPPTSRP